jgi:hypothetical protein
MKIERLELSQLPEATALELHEHTLYSSPRFAELWSSMGGTGVCWLLSERGKVTASLTGIEFRFRPFTRFQAMPDGLYAGYSSQDSDGDERKANLQALLDRLLSHGYAKLFVTDFRNEFGNISGFERRDCCTIGVDISEPGWQPPDPSIRSEIRKAEREEVRIENLDTARHLPGFLELMRGTEERHKRSPKYSDRFYRDLAELARFDPRVQWVVVEHKRNVAASHIYLVDRDSALYWQSFFDKKYSFLKPNQYMLYRMAGRLAAQGVKTLNLGGSPESAEGLRNFKEKWGGVELPYPTYTHNSWAGRLW